MQNILIIGANSAVASELALRYAEDGARLFLVARDEIKLAKLKNKISANVAGAFIMDLNNLKKIPALFSAINSALPSIDLALIAHGYLGDQIQSETDFDEAIEIMQTNYINVVGLLIPLLQQMRLAKKGKVGVLLSVAGDRGRPRNFTYGSAKGALALYLEGLRSVLYKSGVEIHSFKLGPIDSPMTIDHEKNFSFSSVDKVSSLIQKGLKQSKYVHYVPGYWRFVMLAVRWMPEWLFQRLKFLSER